MTQRLPDRPKLIPVIVDVPRDDPGLGFDSYVRAVAGAIMGGQPAQYTVGLYGPWGTGKSSLLMALKKELDGFESPPIVATFDAWRHERSPNLLGPLLWTLKGAMGEKVSSGAWKRIVGGLELSAFGFGFRLPDGTSPDSNPGGGVEAYMDSLQTLAELGKRMDTGRLVVMIDDLDRCSPDRVIEVVESIRLLMDVPGFIFVLAIDYEVLVDAVRHRYPKADAHRFIEKIVQVPFRIPETSRTANFLNEVIGGWTELREGWFGGIDDDEIASVGTLALRGNPRQVKRVLNSFMVARHIDWGTFAQSSRKASTLLACLALQLRWPDEFNDLVDAVGRYLRGPGQQLDRPVLGAVPLYTSWGNRARDLEQSQGMTDDDRDFNEFLSLHLRADAQVRLISETLSLASEVVSNDTEVGSRAEHRSRFVADVLAVAGSSDDVVIVERAEIDGIAQVLVDGECIFRVENPRSVPETFEVWLHRSDWDRIDFSRYRSATRGKNSRLHFGPIDGMPIGEVLDEAAELANEVRAGHGGER